MSNRQMTAVELEFCHQLELRCIASIERTNWTDTPLSEEEKHLIGMAVTWTFYDLKIRENK